MQLKAVCYRCRGSKIHKIIQENAICIKCWDKNWFTIKKLIRC